MTLELTIGPTIRQMRVAGGLLAIELAQAVPVSRSYLSEIEQGHRIPSVALLGDIARGLGVQPADLLLQIHDNLKKASR